jgi:hypothetical protein
VELLNGARDGHLRALAFLEFARPTRFRSDVERSYMIVQSIGGLEESRGLHFAMVRIIRPGGDFREGRQHFGRLGRLTGPLVRPV